MRVKPEQNTRSHAKLPHSCLSMDASMTSKLYVELIHRLRGLLMCLAYFLTCYAWAFVQPGTGGRLVDWCRS